MLNIGLSFLEKSFFCAVLLQDNPFISFKVFKMRNILEFTLNIDGRQDEMMPM